MKKQILLALLALTLTAKATLYSYDFTGINTAIPDGNPVGLANSQTVALGTLPMDGTTTSIVNVDVRLNISGGYNGDLYGYLVLQSADSSTTTTILLNRIGQTGGDFGNSGAGINVTLSSSGATDIHNAAFGAVSGTYQPDGNGSLAFGGANANGTWTLFLADMSGGDISTLVSWGMDISVVPEPITWALLIAGVAMTGLVLYRRQVARA
jgi:subtilisin-like proprotein convertase family protein